MDLPMVGIVVTISPNLSLYRIVVFPAASNPTKIKIKNEPFDNQRTKTKSSADAVHDMGVFRHTGRELGRTKKR